ncbi:SymE family type I addiction module toxin [Rahnella sp. Larv3_ips]|nr:SymE family type I addiction module toxin [Rahnella sp. Larv3_ips]
MTTYYNRYPSLHLKGDWRKDAGFSTDTQVMVAVERGQLVIRPVTE